MKEALSNYIHSSKYAKYIPDLHRRETFKETVLRVRRMHYNRFPNLQTEIYKAFDFVLAKKVLPSMRSMQFAGEPILERNERIYNCSFTLIDRIDVFGKILYLLLCGVGVGYSVQEQHVKKLPRLSGQDQALVMHHIIEDTIEGWANAVEDLIFSFVHGFHVEFSYQKIRPMGSQLKSGGKAPGHSDLKEALEETRSILIKADGRKLKTLECHDIICHLSKAVLAGGIRRSSLIALFSKDDNEMLSCKDKNNFNFGAFNPQRALCNNSVVLDPNTCLKDDLRFIMEWNKKGYGEPGFIFLEDMDTGVNPCGEIGLDPVWKAPYLDEPLSCDNRKHYNEGVQKETGFGFCNLVEINAAACDDVAEFYRACQHASFIATLQASYTSFPFIGKVSEDIAKRDALIGVSITGMMDAKPFIFDGLVLEAGAIEVQRTNELTAKKIGIEPAARCTCIKPSGTSSLELGGVSTGIHPQISKNYLKRIIANPLEPVAQFFKKYNPHMVETKPNGDLCITFPIETKGKKVTDFTASEFIKKILHVYNYWIWPTNLRGPSHNVSCTVTVCPNEWDEVLASVWRNRGSIRCMTFVPWDGRKFEFMPNEPIHPEDGRWIKLIEKYIPVDYELMEESEDTTLRGAACDGVKCGIEDRTFIQGNGYRVFIGVLDIQQTFDGDVNNIQFIMDGMTWKLIEQFDNYFIGQRV